MRIGVPKEIKVHEYRVGLTPAGVRELGVQAVHGVLGFFADPENVRGVFGAAAGALASVIAARPLGRRDARRSDDA